MEDPIRTVQRWLEEAAAAGIANAEAMALATADEQGRPSVRMVLLKGLDERGFTFHTNYESRKGRELDATRRAALALYWQPLGRQVRVEGAVERISREESQAYFATRPPESRLAAWASPQSRPVESREELDRLWEAARARFPGDDVPLPPFWGGYRVVPEAIELWTHHEHRLHDRVRYARDGAGWRAERLAP